ncbi:MAG: efflux RND transporter periplasmic adaptor subunit, partial [Nannocystaceae bacterium]
GCLVMWGLLAACTDLADAGTPGRRVLDPHVRAAVISAASERPESRHRLLLAPKREAQVAARVGGTVETRDVQEQAEVRAGDLLVTLIATDARGALRTAKGSVASAKERLEDNARVLARSKTLEASGAESSREVERLGSSAVALEADLEQARGALVQAKDRVDAAKIRAPFDGTVTAIPVEVGEYAPVGGTVVAVAELGTLALEVPLSEREAVAQDRGELEFMVEVRGNARDHSVEWVSRRAEAETATFTARILVDNTDHSLRAGETAVVRVKSPAAPEVPAVPPEALRWDGPTPYLLRLEDATSDGKRRVRRVDVKVVGDVGRRVAIRSLEEGETVALGEEVVAGGPDTLSTGDEVVVVQAPVASPGEGRP